MFVELLLKCITDFDHLFRYLCEIPIALSLLQSLPGKLSIAFMLNAPCWFISTLFLLYITWPLLKYINAKYLAYRQKKPWILSAGIFVITILFLGASALLKEVATNTWFDGLNYTSPVKQTFPFVLGILLCDYLCYTKNEISIQRATVLETVCVAATCFWYFMWKSISVDIPYIASEAVEIFIPMLLLYVFFYERGYISRLLLKKSIVNLGQLSMYVFLLHWTVSRIPIYITLKFLPHTAIVYVVSLLIVLVAIMSLSLLTSKLNKLVQKI